jgi:hypothetical protein
MQWVVLAYYLYIKNIFSILFSKCHYPAPHSHLIQRVNTTEWVSSIDLKLIQKKLLKCLPPVLVSIAKRQEFFSVQFHSFIHRHYSYRYGTPVVSGRSLFHITALRSVVPRAVLVEFMNAPRVWHFNSLLFLFLLPRGGVSAMPLRTTWSFLWCV